jgi:hypothetical protein
MFDAAPSCRGPRFPAFEITPFFPVFLECAARLGRKPIGSCDNAIDLLIIRISLSHGRCSWSVKQVNMFFVPRQRCFPKVNKWRTLLREFRIQN